MGFGLPAAMGAQVGCPDRLVINIDGDGSFNMTAHELSTLHRYNLPVKNVIINNQYLGMVRQWQDLIYKGHRAESHLADPNQAEWANVDGSSVYPDFVTLAQAYGVAGSGCRDPAALEEASGRCWRRDGPYVLDVIVDPEEDVYPMIPAGATFRDIILDKPARCAAATGDGREVSRTNLTTCFEKRTAPLDAGPAGLVCVCGQNKIIARMAARAGAGRAKEIRPWRKQISPGWGIRSFTWSAARARSP